MLHVGCHLCQCRMSERYQATSFGFLASSDMSPRQTGLLRQGLGWAWRSTHGRWRGAHAMHSGGCLLGRCLPATSHGYSVHYCKQQGRSQMGSVHAANGAQHGSTVLLVESPAKAKKLQQFLGDDYKVQSQISHLSMPTATSHASVAQCAVPTGTGQLSMIYLACSLIRSQHALQLQSRALWHVDSYGDGTYLIRCRKQPCNRLVLGRDTAESVANGGSS